MDLSWIPEGLKQVRLLWESIYDKSLLLRTLLLYLYFLSPFIAYILGLNLVVESES